MARDNAMLRLNKKLTARRDQLLGYVNGDLADLSFSSEAGDEADVAADSIKAEMNCQLAELEGKELSQIQRALVRLKAGTYGACEICDAKIPVARLSALPYTTLCINCQRDLEQNPERAEGLEMLWGGIEEPDPQEVEPVAEGDDLEMKVGV